MGAAEGTRGREVLLGELAGPKEAHIDTCRTMSSAPQTSATTTARRRMEGPGSRAVLPGEQEG